MDHRSHAQLHGAVEARAVERARLDPSVCLRAMASRDRRFEGRFVVAVKTTRVYCRPGCPAPLPKPSNVVFFARAAAAEDAGFRPCRRCRPELSPELRTWPDTSRTVGRAVRLIAEGVLDGDGTIEDLGSRLGVGARHLRRLFAQHLGASPVAVAQSRRVHFARRLVDETTLSVTDVALGSGFASVRRFNDVFRRTFGFSPSRTRSARRAQQSGPLTLRLPFVPPYDWRSMLAFLARRATPGVEVVEANAYRRSIEIDGNVIGLEVQNANDEHCLRLNVRAAPPVDLLRIVSRVRRLFDLDCDPRPIAEHFKRDAHLAAVVRRHPGLRLPGTWDPFELAVRAILGQQVSVTAASTLAGRVVGAFGPRVSIDLPGVTHLFPAPSRLADADIERLGVSSVRARAIRTLAQRIANQSLVLDGRQDVDATIHALNAMPGIGPWTTQYIAMRALHEPDALPAEDLGLRKALARNGDTPSRAEIIRHAERWRPFRAYAVIHLWKSLE